MAKKIGNIGVGGAGLNIGQKDGNNATLKELWVATRDELDDMRTKYAALLAKLDLDTGVTDTDFAALLPYDAPQTEK